MRVMGKGFLWKSDEIGAGGFLGRLLQGIHHNRRRIVVGESHRMAAKSPRIPACVCWLHHTGAVWPPNSTSAIESGLGRGLVPFEQCDAG